MIEDIFGVTFRSLNAHEREAMSRTRELAMEFAEVIANLPPSREKDIAQARLEEALMWTSKSIALHGTGGKSAA